MGIILVTGGTGGLGRPTVDLLRSAGHDVRILSRTHGDGHVVGDLATGAGIDAALDGVETVLHLATSRKKDIDQTELLMAATKRAGVGHFVYISIVGVDEIDFFYYRDKLACERAVEASGVPYTILRATQFHSFIGEFLTMERYLPVVISPDVPFQTIDTADVAARLAELAAAGPAGRVADIGGPEILTFRECAALWQAARGTRKAIWTVHIPGKFMSGMRARLHIPGLPGYGRITFEDYARRTVGEKASR